VWNRLLRTVEKWIDGEDSAESSEAFMFRLLISTPFLLFLLVVMRNP
jgi:hypothetical protein